MNWVLVLIVFVGPHVMDSKLFAASSEAECKATQAKVIEAVKSGGGDPFTSCIEVKRDAKPTVYKIERHT